ncbi:MAG TPA: serine/threonine-protein kinase [Polyangiaceae bacterium]|jgi:tRNA A-37 threonylcarbamoyl transferase component Bud32
MSFAPGTVLAGDFRIERPLAQGGMGAVFVATQLSTGKLRALKTMSPSLVHNPDSMRRFEQEARVGARIASEHVVEVVAAGVDRATGVPYLVMELLEGEDLLSRLKRGPLAGDELRTVVEQLAHAVGAAHDAGVVHRDLKPENVFLAMSRRSGASLVVKVLDFGIAKVTEDERRTTAAYGTPMWLSPEQTHRGEITPAADVWAFGLLVYVMTTGHFFWRSGESPTGSIATLMSEIVSEPIPLASVRAAEQRARVLPGFDAWLARALDRDPRARFRNVREAFDALGPILRPPARAGRAVLVALVAILAVALGGVGAAALYARRTTRAPEPAPLASAPAEFASASAIETATPSASASVTAPALAKIMVTPVSGDTALRAEIIAKVEGALGDALDVCFVGTPIQSRTGAAAVQLFVAPDGHVTAASELYGQRAKPVVQCMLTKIRSESFASRKSAASATFTLNWWP